MAETSEDILKQINDLASGLSEGGEKQEKYSFPEVLPDPAEQYLDDDGLREVDRLESEADLREQWKTEETARMQAEYGRTGVVPQYRTFDEWYTHKEIVQPQQNMQNAIAKDLEDFVDRYPRSSANFLKKVRRGEIEMPDELMTSPNALEEWFISSISEDEFRRMSPEAQLELFAKDGEERKPLRTRSLDIAEPRRVVPKRTPVRPKQQTYKMPDLSHDDFNEMFRDWAIKHPEKMRGR